MNQDCNILTHDFLCQSLCIHICKGLLSSPETWTQQNQTTMMGKGLKISKMWNTVQAHALHMLHLNMISEFEYIYVLQTGRKWQNCSLFPSCPSFLIPSLTQTFLQTRIHLWEQVNRISLCKYLSQCSSPPSVTALASSPVVVSGRAMHMGHINICT